MQINVLHILLNKQQLKMINAGNTQMHTQSFVTVITTVNCIMIGGK